MGPIPDLDAIGRFCLSIGEFPTSCAYRTLFGGVSPAPYEIVALYDNCWKAGSADWARLETPYWSLFCPVVPGLNPALGCYRIGQLFPKALISTPASVSWDKIEQF